MSAAVAVQDEYRDEPGSVIAADFYHSNALMAMDDADIVAKVHRNLITCEPGFAGTKVGGSYLLSALYTRGTKPLNLKPL